VDQHLDGPHRGEAVRVGDAVGVPAADICRPAPREGRQHPAARVEDLDQSGVASIALRVNRALGFTLAVGEEVERHVRGELRPRCRDLAGVGEQVVGDVLDRPAARPGQAGRGNVPVPVDRIEQR